MRRWEYVRSVVSEHFGQDAQLMGAELGVKEGKFSEHLLSFLPNLTMLAVDLWAAQPGNDAKPGGESYEDWDNQSIENQARDKLAPYGDRAIIRKCRTDDPELLKEFADTRFDFIFIDADHSYDGVNGDIKKWRGRVKEGGLIFGHDYNHRWPSVQRAVADNFNIAFVNVGPDSVWWVGV